MSDIIEISGVVKKYGEKVALDGLNLTVKEGELFGFLGPNGAGKTTTVRCITSLTNFQEGTIIVDGHDAVKDQVEAKKVMGLIQQQISLDKDLTIRENMISHAMYHMMGKKERDAKIKELSDYFDLEEYLDKPVDSLSGGWKKRAAIVCAALYNPKVLFLDEPTSGLDVNARRLLWDIIKRMNQKGTTIFLTTHYIEEAELLCDRVGIINHGKIIALDTPSALCESVGRYAVEYMVDKNTKYKYFKDQDEAKQFASTLDVSNNVLLRKTNLEDVFVELTGSHVGA